jgi:hypothetical protein
LKFLIANFVFFDSIDIERKEAQFMKLKKLDYIIIGTLILLTVISSTAVFISSRRKFDELYVNIEVNGKFYKKVPLYNVSEKVKVKTERGINIIEVVNGKVHVEEADCPDKICVKDGFIHRPGEILVCLPNKVVIQIQGKNREDVDDTAY